jgi:hypothetical protein
VLIRRAGYSSMFGPLEVVEGLLDFAIIHWVGHRGQDSYFPGHEGQSGFGTDNVQCSGEQECPDHVER